MMFQDNFSFRNHNLYAEEKTNDKKCNNTLAAGKMRNFAIKIAIYCIIMLLADGMPVVTFALNIIATSSCRMFARLV